MSEKYKSEYAPVWKSVKVYPPPLGTKVLLRTEFGTCIVGTYYPEGKFGYWAGLPKLSEKDKKLMTSKNG